MVKKSAATPIEAESTAMQQEGSLPTAGADTVIVYCNLPNGIAFALPDGRSLQFKGYPISRLVGADGAALPAGRYGVTPGVARQDWEYIAGMYAGCAFFKNGLLFAENDAASGRDRARDMAGTRHGMEQADVWNRTGDKRLPQGSTKTGPEKTREE